MLTIFIIIFILIIIVLFLTKNKINYIEEQSEFDAQNPMNIFFDDNSKSEVKKIGFFEDE
jgi:hypothetical protein